MSAYRLAVLSISRLGNGSTPALPPASAPTTALQHDAEQSVPEGVIPSSPRVGDERALLVFALLRLQLS